MKTFLFKPFVVAVLLCCRPVAVPAQVPQQTPPSETAPETEADVLRISAALIQTGVAVFDKKGNFVDNLGKEDFELRVNGKPTAVSFFERVAADGGAGKIENKQLTERRVASSKLIAANGLSRTVIFVVDDLHLSFNSHHRAKKLISKFIEVEMRPEDRTAIVSSSGKIGFLQQFTSDKTVLRAALERLIFNRDYSSADRLSPPMSEYEALLIDRHDQQITDIFANLVMRESPGTTLESARLQVRTRARATLLQAGAISKSTYLTTEQVLRNSASLPGRKIVFFISDGFLLDPANNDASYRLRRIADAAARVNAVIYSFDAKGLEAGLPDNTSRSYRVQSGERSELQDPLNQLSDSTGGRFVRNTNDLQTGLDRALAETSRYYLLAWQPGDAENVQPDEFRQIEISVKGRSDLTVRAQAGFLNEPAKATPSEKSKKTASAVPADSLRVAAAAPIALRSLPTALALNYLDLPNEGAALIVSLQISGSAVEFPPAGANSSAALELLGIVFSAEGKPVGGFRENLTRSIAAAESSARSEERSDVLYNYQIKLKPGLYQVRAAVRDAATGRLGSALEWITIPDLSKRKLTLSSILLGEETGTGKTRRKTVAATETALGTAEIGADRRFARSSLLRYIVFVYNAARGQNSAAASPNVTIQTEIRRGDEIVLSSQPNRIAAGLDAARLPYAAEISLKDLTPGRYTLHITVRDQMSNTDTSRSIDIEII